MLYFIVQTLYSLLVNYKVIKNRLICLVDYITKIMYCYRYIDFTTFDVTFWYIEVFRNNINLHTNYVFLSKN